MHTFAPGFDWTVSKEKSVSKPSAETPEGEVAAPATEYSVVEGDCLEAAEALLARGMRPVVLNMASDHTPGGGYRGGSGAQEENLFRRTNLLRVLSNEDRWYDPRGKGEVAPNKLYPLPDPSTLYSPSVFVLRSSEARGYLWLERPYEVAFIASAAYRRPRLEKDNLHLIEKFADGFKDKVRGVLWTAATHGHDSCVLSAWGCGAFRNPPLHIAQLFQQVLNEEWIRGVFKNITFAIFDDHNSRKEHNPDGNVLPFQQVFSPSSTTAASSTRAASSSSTNTNSTTASSSSIPGGTRKTKADRKKKHKHNHTHEASSSTQGTE